MKTLEKVCVRLKLSTICQAESVSKSEHKGALSEPVGIKRPPDIIRYMMTGRKVGVLLRENLSITRAMVTAVIAVTTEKAMSEKSTFPEKIPSRRSPSGISAEVSDSTG